MSMIIAPYEAVGPLHFGMSQDEVVASIGSPNRHSKNRTGNPVLWYNGLNVTIENGGLVEVGFGPEEAVAVLGVSPFSDSDALARLCELDGNPQEVLGFIVLQKVGITLTGFHDNNESQKAVTAFSRGRWDALRSKMTPFVVPRGTESRGHVRKPLISKNNTM